MKTASRDLRHEAGRLGEAACMSYLRRRGYRIKDCNYRAGHKEIDVIAETLFSIVFVEVKTRTAEYGQHRRYGTPSAAVTKEKQQLISAAAQVYLACHPTSKHVRFDVMEVYIIRADDSVSVSHINHIKNAY